MGFLHNFFRADTLLDGISPLIFVGRISGVAPFKYNLKTNRSRLHIPFFLFAVCCSLLYLIFLAEVILENEVTIEFSDLSKTFVSMSDMSTIYLGFASMICISLSIFIKMHHMAKIQSRFIEIDALFKLISVTMNYTWLKRRLIAGITCQYFLHNGYIMVQVLLLRRLGKPINQYKILVQYVPGICAIFTLIIFNCFLSIVVQFLKKLNQTIEAMTTDQQTFNVNLLNYRRLKKSQQTQAFIDAALSNKVSTIWKIYDKICDSCEDIDKSFSFNSLTIFTVAFICMVFNLFNILYATAHLYMGSKSTDHYVSLLISLYQSCVYFVILLIPSIHCDICSRKAKETATWINRMMVTETNESIVTKLHLMSTHMLHRVPKFSACGLFVIDHSLIFTIVGATTTYMVILIQFSVTSD